MMITYLKESLFGAIDVFFVHIVRVEAIALRRGVRVLLAAAAADVLVVVLIRSHLMRLVPRSLGARRQIFFISVLLTHAA